MKPIDVRVLKDGDLDEVVADNCAVHLERMSDNHVWLEIRKGSQTVVVDLESSAGVFMRHTREKRQKPRTNIPRDTAIVREREEGVSLEKISERHGISRERIRQIIKRDRSDLIARPGSQIRQYRHAPRLPREFVEAARDLWHADNNGAPLLGCREIAESLEIGMNSLIGLAHRNYFRKRVSGVVMAWAE